MNELVAAGRRGCAIKTQIIAADIAHPLPPHPSRTAVAEGAKLELEAGVAAATLDRVVILVAGSVKLGAVPAPPGAVACTRRAKRPSVRTTRT